MTAALLSRSPGLIMEAPTRPLSPEWHALRRTGLGGSDAAAALGLSDRMSPFELWLDKQGRLPPREDDGPMLWGRMLEPLVRSFFMQATGREFEVPNTTFRSAEHPFMLANLDGLMPGRLYEGKTARTAEGWGEPGSADIPLAYMLQVQHYMRVMLVPVTDVAVLIGGSDFRMYEVPADRELQDMLVEGEQAMWERVLALDPPAPESVEDARLRWGSLAAKGAIRASADAARAVETLRDATEHRKNLEGVEAEAKALLMGALGDHGDVLVDAEGKPLVTWKLAAAPKRFDTEAFAIEHPGLYADYVREGKASRRFLLKGSP